MVVSDFVSFDAQWNPIWIDALLPELRPPCFKSGNVQMQLGYNDVGFPCLKQPEQAQITSI